MLGLRTCTNIIQDPIGSLKSQPYSIQFNATRLVLQLMTISNALRAVPETIIFSVLLSYLQFTSSRCLRFDVRYRHRANAQDEVM